MHKLQH